MGSRTVSNRIGIGLCLCLAGLAACASDDDAATVSPSVELVGATTEAFAASSLTAVNGTYSGCLQRSGAWSARISGNGALANPALSVVKDDTGCSLLVTELVGDATYVATPSITLGTSYPGGASSMAVSGGTMAFLANAKIDSLSFAGDFTITVRVSDDVSASDSGSLTATYATVQSTVSASIVAASDYTLSLTSGTAFTLQMNASSVVQAVAGNATLTDGTVPGTSYAIDMGTLPASPTYLQVTGAYLAATSHAIAGANPTIPASQFNLVGQNLSTPVVRTIIVTRTLVGVTSYQLFKVTFEAS